MWQEKGMDGLGFFAPQPASGEYFYDPLWIDIGGGAMGVWRRRGGKGRLRASGEFSAVFLPSMSCVLHIGSPSKQFHPLFGIPQTRARF